MAEAAAKPVAAPPAAAGRHPCPARGTAIPGTAGGPGARHRARGGHLRQHGGDGRGPRPPDRGQGRGDRGPARPADGRQGQRHRRRPERPDRRQRIEGSRAGPPGDRRDRGHGQRRRPRRCAGARLEARRPLGRCADPGRHGRGAGEPADRPCGRPGPRAAGRSRPQEPGHRRPRGAHGPLRRDALGVHQRREPGPRTHQPTGRAVGRRRPARGARCRARGAIASGRDHRRRATRDRHDRGPSRVGRPGDDRRARPALGR